MTPPSSFVSILFHSTFFLVVFSLCQYMACLILQFKYPTYDNQRNTFVNWNATQDPNSDCNQDRNSDRFSDCVVGDNQVNILPLNRRPGEGYTCSGRLQTLFTGRQNSIQRGTLRWKKFYSSEWIPNRTNLAPFQTLLSVWIMSLDPILWVVYLRSLRSVVTSLYVVSGILTNQEM